MPFLAMRSRLIAQSLFDRIDKNLQPNVFLLRILIDQSEDRRKIGLEPENCGYDVNLFSDNWKMAEGLDPSIPDEEWVDLIKKILERGDLCGDTEKYVSSPTSVKGFLVFTVLELQKSTIDGYYSLNKRSHVHIRINRSFIESTIDVYFNECSNALNNPNKGYLEMASADEILRKSGAQFMLHIAVHTGCEPKGVHSIYNSCNIISSMNYEGNECTGKLAVAPKKHIQSYLTIQLKKPIKLCDYRKARKLLELSSKKDSIIISDSELIYGLGEIVGKYNPIDESLFIIRFKSHFKWEVLHANNSMMVVEYSLPNVPKDRINREKFYLDLPRIFKDVRNRQIDDLWDVVINAIAQKHGTMVVISDNAENESKRLGKQCFAIKPIKLQSNLIQQITSIDGAILLDRDSTCFAIGVILDGLATEKGDSSRGSRYNSAIRYCEQFGKTTPLLIVTISEDGMINLIPNLRPQINHSDITDRIAELSELNKTGKAEKNLNQLMDWFRTNQFYLTESECVEINAIRKEIEQKEKERDPTSTRIVRKDLKPNKEMNDSFYK